VNLTQHTGCGAPGVLELSRCRFFRIETAVAGLAKQGFGRVEGCHEILNSGKQLLDAGKAAAEPLKQYSR
jgi:hypothetical protein